MHIPVSMKYIPMLILTIIFPPGVVFAQEINISGADSVKPQQQITDTNITEKEVTNGYIVNRIRDVTGSVSFIEPALLIAIPSGNVGNLLQGRASGVTVTGSGRPGETSLVRIRGFSSFLNNDPLYVIDGVPTQDISSINPEDVASVSVLKDAGSASIYGSRASNGVIIITTKRGEKGFKVTYNMSMGIQNPGKGTAGDMLDTKEYADLQWLVYNNDGTEEYHPIYGDSRNPAPSLPPWAANTDWYDEITDPAGIQNHDLTLSGGSENAKFYAGFGFFSQDGIIINTHDTKYSTSLNSDFTLLNSRIKLGENLTMSYNDYLSAPNLSENSPIQMGPYRSQSIIPVIITQPIAGMTHNFIPGEWGGTGIAPRLGYSSNPVATLTRDKNDKFRSSRLTGSTFLDIMIIDGLNFRSTFGGTYIDGHQTDYTIAPYEDAPTYPVPVSDTTKNDFRSSDWVWTNIVTFNKQFGQHKILAVAGYEAVNYGMGQTISDQDTIPYTPTRLLSTFIKVDYAFRDKYLLSATLRRDGCSKFSESQRYGMFPSFTAGWRIGDEHFLDGLNWISDLKIRGSWGKTGNQFSISPQNAVYLFGESIGGSYYDLYGTFNSSVRGYYPLRIGNPDAIWESNTTTDIGFDAGLFNSKVSIVFDWYSKKADNLLYNPPLPGTAGTGEAPYVNVASMKNSGIDIELSYQNRWNNLGLNASIIFTTYNNQITRIAEGTEYFGSGDSRIGNLVRNEEGHQLSSFYGYRVVGIFKDQTEVENAPEQESAAPGFLMFENQDTLTNEYWLWTQERYKRKSFIDYRDKTYIGNPNPDFTYGINLALSWKNFDISGFFYGVQGNETFNYNKWWTDFWPSFQGQKSRDLLYKSWTEQNKGATVPKASSASHFSTNTQVCSYYIEDGSYLRLKNLQVGYTFPKNMTDKIKIRSLRMYLQAVNLFTLTKYSGLDPEIGGNDLAFGIDYGNYPNAKQFIFGLNLIL
jgi:TonB-dependent starch-binding outer membrane protein SusC